MDAIKRDLPHERGGRLPRLERIPMTNRQDSFLFVASARKSWGAVLLVLFFTASDVFAQSENIPVSFTLEAPQPTCSVAKLKDINFGVLGRPSTGTGYAWLDERFEGDKLYPRDGVTRNGGTPTIGKLKITAGNANTLTLMWGFPEKLVMGDHEIEYRSNHYAHSRNEDGPKWDRLTWEPRLTLPYDGVEAHGTHYFQIGGEVYISHDTEPGHYTDTMTLTVSCPE